MAPSRSLLSGRPRVPFAKQACLFSLLWLVPGAVSLRALTPEDLERRFKPLPTVPEAEMPALPNRLSEFPGIVEHEGLEAATWVRFPFVENPGSFGFDAQGRLYVAEANRFWLGVPDLRGVNQLIRDDFRSRSVEDRAAMYEKFAADFPEGWFSRVADRIILLEDTDGSGAPDRRSVFSDRFREPLDGIGFSLLADGGSVYFTCIPHLWKLTDTTGDGIADEEEILSTGYGVQVSFIGHDLHGLVMGPDGRLYYSVGDRGYHLEDGEGRLLEGARRGAVFRCEPDGSGLELVATGLRNPQELAFDDHGNLFTFDNTGDIGDLARMVYVLEGTDSGWDMAHQSAHHYATHLDWGEFRPERSMWVHEKMYDLHSEEQPQWVYPPASHVARGPSGVTWLTGESVPPELRGKFLLTNYLGASENCTVLLVGIEPQGAGYVASSEEILARGVGASDVELGYDGGIYLCDFGGGWSVNENGAVHVMRSSDPAAREAGAAVATLFRDGFETRETDELAVLLSHSDRRVRQAAHLALARRAGESGSGDAALATLVGLAAGENAILETRLHTLWSLGHVARVGSPEASSKALRSLLPFLDDPEEELRANAARTLGDLRHAPAREGLLSLLENDASLRVRSLAAVALGRVASRGSGEGSGPALVDALFRAAAANEAQGGSENGDGESAGPDIVLRHALLTALDGLAETPELLARAGAASREARLLAVLALRRREDPGLLAFLDDADPLVAREAMRALYDTAAADTPAGEALAALAGDARFASLPEPVQRRVVAANYRGGEPGHALRLLEVAGNPGAAPTVRIAALRGLLMWEAVIDTDPVHGHFRPQRRREGREMEILGETVGDSLRGFLSGDHPGELVALGVELATRAGVALDRDLLIDQAANAALAPDLRVAVVESLASTVGETIANSGAIDIEVETLIRALLEDETAEVRAAAIETGFALGIGGMQAKAREALAEAPLLVARAALAGLSETEPEALAALWEGRDGGLRPGLWLDLYLHLAAAGHAAAADYAASDPHAVFRLSLHGGDAARGASVFRNQGACLQCHRVGGEGGIQGPDLSEVASRLSREKILESIYDPGAELTPGYGMTSAILKDGRVLLGRIAEEGEAELLLVALDGEETRVTRAELESLTPPVSAMPPTAAVLPPADLRDLVAYLAAQGSAGRRDGADEAAHGGDEKIAK